MGLEQAIKTSEFNDKVVIVDDTLLELFQHHLLRMIREVSEALDAQGIRWCLSGGSILGAVRHQGFIPWDDDIDIFMERAEFEKLKKVFAQILGDRYVLRVPGDKGYLLHFPRIEDKKCFVKSIQSTGKEENGLFLDVFILENTYNNAFLRKLHGIRSTAYLFADSCVRTDLCKENLLYYTNQNPAVKKEVDRRARFAFLFKFRKPEKWMQASDRCFSGVRKKTDYLVCPSGARHFFGEIFLREKMDGDQRLPFEDLELPVPKAYDYYVKTRYGDGYMVIPPPEKRERHVYAKVRLAEKQAE